MPEGVTLSELARRLGRAKSGLHKLAASKQIPRLADGSFDQAAVEAALARNLDPARRKPVNETAVNGERENAGSRDSALAFEDAAHRGAAWLGLAILYRLPAISADLSISAGASIATAFALRRLIAVATMIEVEDTLTSMGADVALLRYQPDAFDDLDWRRAAKQAGEIYNPAAWNDHLATVNETLEAA